MATKNEIDKDSMYKKLMPSAPIAKTEEAAAPAARRNETEETASGRKTSGPRKIRVPAMESRKTAVVNTMEALVLEKLDSVLARFQCCRCDRCKKDIVALALNKLPPKYMAIPEGQPGPDLDPQVNAQVLTALIQAVLQVRSHPRH